MNWESTVWVGGKQVGQHKGGYDAFHFDITEYLKDGENEITVKVSIPPTKGRSHAASKEEAGRIFYTPATGIWQTVWLEPVIREVSISG